MDKELKAIFDALVTDNEVVLFMKGTRERPQCGFSKQVIEVLNGLISDFLTVDVLADPKIREGIKQYSDWPTIPQLYVHGEFVGGCDIVLEQYQNNELQNLLGLEKASDIPLVKITDSAQKALENAQADCEDDERIRLGIGVDFRHSLSFDQKKDGDFSIQFDELEIIIDPYSAHRAEDLLIDYIIEDLDAGFLFSNPNEPPLVQELSVAELKTWRDQGRDALLVDVRPEAEQELATISFATSLASLNHPIKELKKNQTIVFHCHHGGRSKKVAESFRLNGFTNLYNLTGGIDAWSKQIDQSVPTYSK